MKGHLLIERFEYDDEQRPFRKPKQEDSTCVIGLLGRGDDIFVPPKHRLSIEGKLRAAKMLKLEKEISEMEKALSGA